MVTPLLSAVHALKEGNKVLEELQLAVSQPHEQSETEQTVASQVQELTAKLEDAIAAKNVEAIRRICQEGRFVARTAKKANEYGLREAQKEYEKALENSRLKNSPENTAAVDAAVAEVKVWSESLYGLNDDILDNEEQFDEEAIIASMNTPDTTTAETGPTLAPTVTVEHVETRLEPERKPDRAEQLLKFITSTEALIEVHKNSLRELAKSDQLKAEHYLAKINFADALDRETIGGNGGAIKKEAGITDQQS